MRANSLVDRHEIFLCGACVGAHSNSQGEGFRQKDIKFLLELFINWFDGIIEESQQTIQNTQISRFIEQLVKDGFAQKFSRSKVPQYRLTRLGLIELISRMVERKSFCPLEYFFFVFYFVENYRRRIEELVQKEGRLFPHSLRIELEALLDPNTLLQRHIATVKRELSKLNVRVEEANKTAQLALRLFREGAGISQVAKEIERLYPYELNSQKPLSSFFAEIPPSMAKWELEIGSRKRGDQLFQTLHSTLTAHLKIVEKIGSGKEKPVLP